MYIHSSQRSVCILLFVSCIICYIQKFSVPVYYNDHYGEKSTTTTSVHSTATTQFVEIPKPGSTQPATTDSNYSDPVITVTITVLLMIVIFGGIGGIFIFCRLKYKHEQLKQKYQSQLLETENKNHDASNDKKEYQTLNKQNNHSGENDPLRRSHRTRTTTKPKYVIKRCFPFCWRVDNEKYDHNSIESLECGSLLKQSPSNATETTDIQRGPVEATDVPHGFAKAADRQHEPAVTTTQRESNRNFRVCDTDVPDGGAVHDGNQPSGENVVHEFSLNQTLSGRVLDRPSDQHPPQIVPSSHVSGGNPPFMRSVSTQSQLPDDEPRLVPSPANIQPSAITQGTQNQAPPRSATGSSNSGSVVIQSPPTRATNTGQPVRATTVHHPTIPETSHSQTLTNSNLQAQPPTRSSASSRPAAESSSAGVTPIASSNAVQNLPSVNSYSQAQPSRPSAVHNQPIISLNAPQQVPSGPRAAHHIEAENSHAEARLSAIPSAAQPARSVAADGHPSMGQNQPSISQNQPSYGHNIASGGYNSRLQRQQPGVPQPGHAVGADSGLFVDSALLDSLGPSPSDYAEQIERAYAEAEEELEAHPSQRGCYDNVSIDLGGDSSEASEHPVASMPDTFAMDLDERVVTSPASSVVREQQQQRQQQTSVSQSTQPRDQRPPVDQSGETELKRTNAPDRNVSSETPQPPYPIRASGEIVPVKATPGTVIRPVPPGRGKLIKQAP